MSVAFARRVTTAILLATLTGCSSVGAVNGMRLDEGNTDHSTICGDYEWLCIGAGLAVLGGTIAVLQENVGHNPERPHTTP
jgi:hypothetical protein